MSGCSNLDSQAVVKSYTNSEKYGVYDPVSETLTISVGWSTKNYIQDVIFNGCGDASIVGDEDLNQEECQSLGGYWRPSSAIKCRLCCANALPNFDFVIKGFNVGQDLNGDLSYAEGACQLNYVKKVDDDQYASYSFKAVYQQKDSFINDIDSDGVVDDLDNCVSESNADQVDVDGDGFGDVCDSCPLNNEFNDLVCTQQYSPVCGVDGVTYGNSCLAQCAGVSFVGGSCSQQDDNNTNTDNNTNNNNDDDDVVVDMNDDGDGVVLTEFDEFVMSLFSWTGLSLDNQKLLALVIALFILVLVFKK